MVVSQTARCNITSAFTHIIFLAAEITAGCGNVGTLPQAAVMLEHYRRLR
jgi:hypothetical protein